MADQYDDDLPREPKAPTPADRLRPGRQGVEDLEEQEEQLWQGGYSGKAMIGSWVLAALVSFALLAGAVVGMAMVWVPIAAFSAIALIWLWLASVYLYRRMSVQYELTTQRFLHREGILSRRTERIEVIDMDDITCTQGFFERLVGVGTIKIDSSDRTHPELYLKGIDDALEVADLMDNVRRKERRRRGLHIESI